jgi:hypothetical protein
MTWAFTVQRVTGIKPALSTWGIRPIGASDRPELGIRHTASDRDGPCVTGVNGPLMARGLMAAALLLARHACQL